TERMARRIASDVSCRHRVARLVCRSGQVLQRPRDHEALPKREASVELQLRLTPERRHNMAVQQVLRAVDHEATIAQRPTGVDPAAESAAATEPHISREVNEVV